jgi:hypothetical protein
MHRGEVRRLTVKGIDSLFESIVDRYRVCFAVRLTGVKISPSRPNPSDCPRMAKADGIKYDYTKKDVILYNLGLGAKHTDLSLVFEDSPSFEVLPSFGTAVF